MGVIGNDLFNKLFDDFLLVFSKYGLGVLRRVISLARSIR